MSNESVIFPVISFLSSIVGTICGIGGGVIIKPVLDLTGLASVSTISFLSGCTVLSMSFYSVSRNLFSRDNRVNLKTGTPLAIGAALGGTVGNQIFNILRRIFENQNTVGAVQAACLALVTLGTLLYTIYKRRIRTHCVSNIFLCLGIGTSLGVMSSFLGIGGGPINLVVLFHFFCLDTKTAAQNSLYMILFSQAANILTTILSHTVPLFDPYVLLLMIAGGIGGGIVGRILNKKMSNAAVDRLFLVLMSVIILISLWNVWKYSHVA